VESDSLARLDRLWRGREQFQVTVEHGGRLKQTGNGEYHPALDIGYFHALQVERRTLSRARNVRREAVNLNAPDASGALRRKDFDFFLLVNLAGNEGTCNDSSETLHCETSIDRKPEDPGCVLRLDRL